MPLVLPEGMERARQRYSKAPSVNPGATSVNSKGIFINSRQEADWGGLALADILFLQETPLNQHFIYNTLNHVQYFINKGEKEASLNYIIRLSRLLRQWMHDTTQSAVSITDELSLLSGYLALEQLRFSGRFTFEVTSSVPEGEGVFITPHIIFPLAEHAVSWCLRHSEEGAIRIHISAAKPFLHCAIDARAGAESLAAGLHLLPRQNHRS